jgi:hypothetical protein
MAPGIGETLKNAGKAIEHAVEHTLDEVRDAFHGNMYLSSSDDADGSNTKTQPGHRYG